MSDQTKRCRKAKCCQAEGCTIDLIMLDKPYHLKKRLCPEHMAAEVTNKKGSAGQWRFCQQCGRLEPLQQFEGMKRSCRSGLQRRRKTHHVNAATGKSQQQQEQSCLAGEHLSGPSRQASSHHAGEHLSGLGAQAGNSLSGLGLYATWNPSLAAAAAAHHRVCYGNNGSSGRFLPKATTPSISQELVLSSPATSATEPAAPPAAAPPAAAPMHQTAAVPYAAPLQGMAAAAAVRQASGVCSRMQAQQQQPVGLVGEWQPAVAASDAAWTAAAPGLPAKWQPAASTATAAAEHPGFGMFQASTVDLQPWTANAAAVASSHRFWCADPDAADAAILDEIEQQLLLELNFTQQQQQTAAGQFAPPPPPAAAAVSGMPGPNQLRRELSRAAALARLQELSREFAVLQQALQDGLAADLEALQRGQTATQLQQQQVYGGALGTTSMQSCGHVWQI